MSRFDLARSAGRLVRAVTNTDLTGKAKRSAAALKVEYDSGKRGDESPVTPIWATPKEQCDAIVRLLRSPRSSPPRSGDELDAEAVEVAQAIRGVDWSGVRVTAAQRTSDAARAMRAMAEQVDWTKVQPVAAQVSSALIAGVATGQIRVGGRAGPMIARAIADQAGLAQRVARTLDAEDAPLPPDFRQVIDVTAEEA